jgi:hypothetical protein
MTGFFEDMLLRQEGLEDQDIADLNKALPDIQALDVALQAQLPRITRIAPVILRVINKVIAKQRTLT